MKNTSKDKKYIYSKTTNFPEKKKFQQIATNGYVQTESKLAQMITGMTHLSINPPEKLLDQPGDTLLTQIINLSYEKTDR